MQQTSLPKGSRKCPVCNNILRYKSYDSYRHALRNNKPCRSCSSINARKLDRKYFFNENYFEKIDSNNKAYILGLFAADGCNNKSGFILALQKNDIDILLKIKNEIGNTSILPNKNNMSLSYWSVKMCEDLIKLGVFPNKSHKLCFPSLQDKFISHFIRGYMDGDGSIGIDYKRYKKPYLTFTGNDCIINEIRRYLNLQGKVKGYITCRNPKTSPNIITLIYNGGKSVIKILKWLYKDSDIHLDRKFIKFKEICNEKN